MSRRLVVCGLSLLALIACSRASAKVTFGVQGWNAQLSGNVYNPQYRELGEVQMRRDLNMGRHWNPNFIFAFTTPAFLPDVRLEYGLLQSDGTNDLHREFCLFGLQFYVNGSVVSQAALKQARILFYWNPVDNRMVNLRMGFDARWVSLNLSATGFATAGESGTCVTPVTFAAGAVPPTANPNLVVSGQRSTSAGVVTWFGDLNLGLIVHLPANFDIYFKGSGLPYASNYIYDLRAGLKYHFGTGLALGVGYRRWRLHLDDTSLSVNGTLDFKGPYAALYWSF